MNPTFGYLLSLLTVIYGTVAAVTFTVPERARTGSYKYAPLDLAPVGISFEFFAFPSYFTNVTATNQCLANWKDLTGVWPPIRIGGTTQDRAQYDAGTSAYVVYSVSNPADAPSSLTFGSSFLTLAGGYGGSVVVGLNRGKNQIQNTIDAARIAASEVKNLLAIELGNEPEYYSRNGQPIASGGWSPAIDAASQNNWAISVGSAVNKRPIIQAGNSNDSPPQWGAEELIATQNATVKQYIKTYSHHNYPGGSITSLMSHKGISSNLHVFDADVAAALKENKPYIFGETNSVSGGGAAGVSPTFGAALWTMDYVLRATYSNISRTYFHHGTVGNCQYCFWGRYSMGAPYYGAYAATALLAKAAYLTALDDGSTNYAAYVSFGADGSLLRALLYNSDYFDGSGSRSSQSFELRGLTGTTLKAKRLTADSATSRVDRGGVVSFGGQTFTDGNCKISGTEETESLSISDGRTTVTLKASEALLVYFR
ncbi:glycoside hydrolase family 79 protein [Durotheca rogersii]|uniref:glycoside hydrolase family 79 protein n=1 Tax=Durotheca rogersii TaxID=419775 RepID=UPI002220A0FD|nr:glycoside hydrolase family 79 protein [Durotheca rogersii]KAI5865244.1 glycoside hydrolase family 79 protein [Durotheca rogersii]